MNHIEFLPFNQVGSDDLMAILNEDCLRTHLIDHPYFDSASVQIWMADKIKVDAMPGCRVRAVSINGVLAGWCGIQPDDDSVELAIVISQQFWGFGRAIFKSLIGWANELGHTEVVFHLLDSRPEYKALDKIAINVHKTEQLGRCFTTYRLSVARQ